VLGCRAMRDVCGLMGCIGLLLLSHCVLYSKVPGEKRQAHIELTTYLPLKACRDTSWN
jgi:hypothetical protein